MQAPDRDNALRRIAGLDDADIDLAGAALMLAARGRPGVSTDRYRDHLDTLAAEVGAASADAVSGPCSSAAIALASVFHAVGERISERLAGGAISGYVELLAGALILGVLHFVPLLGELLWLFALLAGAGAVLTTRLGRRRHA